MDLQVNAAMSKPDNNGIRYTFAVEASYRVNDAEVAALVGFHTGMSGEAPLQPDAKDVMEDGAGGNIYKAKGTNEVAAKEAGGQMKIIGCQS